MNYLAKYYDIKCKRASEESLRNNIINGYLIKI